MTVMPRSSRRAIAVVMRDAHGSLVDDTVCMVAVSLATQGEALAVRLACLVDSSLNQTMVEIEGDNKQVIQLCLSGCTTLGVQLCYYCY
ncbi:hypothetical protein ACSBR2_010375 [Camellia fascicularis]